MRFVSPGVGNAQSNKVVIGYANFSPTYAPVWVAKDMGFFDKHNVNAETIFIRGGAMGTQALVSRSFDFIIAGGVAAIEAALAGAESSSSQCRPIAWTRSWLRETKLLTPLNSKEKRSR